MSDGLSSRKSYAGMIYYEDDDLVTFATTKRLNALLQVHQQLLWYSDHSTHYSTLKINILMPR